jgi:uncharacterized membrane protein (UPF0127 family)
MPNSATKKIASARKYLSSTSWALLLLTAVNAPFLALMVIRSQSVASPDTLQAGNHTYRLVVADSSAEQEKGLGGRRSLPQDQGMLFAFTGEDVRCFWMKDTHIPLDMIWLNSQKRILHIEPSVQPNTYPRNFCPKAPARYVIELNAGEAARAHLTAGETLTF